MTLIDSGPLVALINRSDGHHLRCLKALDQLRYPLVTTWPVVTEAMHLLGKVAHWVAQDGLWQMVLKDEITIAPLDTASMQRMRALMKKYRDTPMDLADASLVAVAEMTKLRQIFTLDSDFNIYRIDGRQRFNLIP